MPGTNFEPELRPATPDDAPLVAELESLRVTTDPRDPVLLAHWWKMNDELERSMRRIPILRINEEMGYRLVAPVIELHRSLRA